MKCTVCKRTAEMPPMTGAWTEITNEEDPPMIALIDYDAGNIKAWKKPFKALEKRSY